MAVDLVECFERLNWDKSECFAESELFVGDSGNICCECTHSLCSTTCTGLGITHFSSEVIKCISTVAAIAWLSRLCIRTPNISSPPLESLEGGCLHQPGWGLTASRLPRGSILRLLAYISTRKTMFHNAGNNHADKVVFDSCQVSPTEKTARNALTHPLCGFRRDNYTTSR